MKNGYLGRIIMAPVTTPWPFQYAAKFVCGKVGEPGVLAVGNYDTSVNIHNPSYSPLEFRFKLAEAKGGGDGQVHEFRPGTMGPDGAQYIGCKLIREIYGASLAPPIDGFLVIECTRSLDVVAVYTTNDIEHKGVPAIAVERVFERRTG
jgi:hypothetical protein